MPKKILRLLFPAIALVTACESEPHNYLAARADSAERHVLPPDTIIDSPDGPLLVETIAAGLTVPWDFAFLPDGRILFTERSGRIRVLVNDTVAADPWAQLEVYGDDPVFLPESGLMGIAAHPGFADNGQVFVMATVRREAGIGERIARRLGRGAAPYENRIYRFTDSAGRASDPVQIAADMPASYYHAGGALRFGPDGHVYFSIGDVIDSPRAQDPMSRIGAILRMSQDGTVPADNPHSGEPVYAHGLRNVQGMEWTADGTMLAIDHGPSALPHESGRFGHDELNVIRAGANYGWPDEAGRVEEPHHIPPIVDWMPGIAPAGLAVYDHDRVTQWRGSLFVTGLRGQQLRRLSFDAASKEVTDDVTMIAGFGRLRAVAVGPDGALYVSTSNRDGRGTPSSLDDRILRITPATTGSAPTR